MVLIGLGRNGESTLKRNQVTKCFRNEGFIVIVVRVKVGRNVGCIPAAWSSVKKSNQSIHEAFCSILRFSSCSLRSTRLHFSYLAAKCWTNVIKRRSSSKRFNCNGRFHWNSRHSAFLFRLNKWTFFHRLFWKVHYISAYLYYSAGSAIKSELWAFPTEKLDFLCFQFSRPVSILKANKIIRRRPSKFHSKSSSFTEDGWLKWIESSVRHRLWSAINKDPVAQVVNANLLLLVSSPIYISCPY